MKPVLAAALVGMQRAERQMVAAASNVARTSLEGAKALRAEGDKIVETDSSPDLATDVVTISSAKTQYKASAAVARTADETTKSLLDIVG